MGDERSTTTRGVDALVPDLLNELREANTQRGQLAEKLPQMDRSIDRLSMLAERQQAKPEAQTKDGCDAQQAECKAYQEAKFAEVHKAIKENGRRPRFWPETAKGWVPVVAGLIALLLAIVAAGWKARDYIEDLIEERTATRSTDVQDAPPVAEAGPQSLPGGSG